LDSLFLNLDGQKLAKIDARQKKNLRTLKHLRAAVQQVIAPPNPAPREAGQRGTLATYSGNTQSGTLTVTDGTHIAHVRLLGNYVAGQFHLSDDGHGGTLVTDPPLNTSVNVPDALAGPGHA
jgi:hypothetical protein